MSYYRTILADPPWQYNDKLRQDPTIARGAGDVYPTMSTEDICNLADVSTHESLTTIAGKEIEEEAFLFLWVTNGFLLNGDGAEVCEAWGFTPKQIITWVKTKKQWVMMAALGVDGGINPARVRDGVRCEEVSPEEYSQSLNEEAMQMGMGRITRSATEQIIVATRGKYSKHVMAKNRRNVIFAPRREHSQKPVAQYDLIEAICPGPYLELFAREERKGWDSWGNEL